MQTNAKAEQAGFKASGGQHFPLKTMVQKDTFREPKKNRQLGFNINSKPDFLCFFSGGPHFPLKTLVYKDTLREPKKNIQLHYDEFSMSFRNM